MVEPAHSAILDSLYSRNFKFRRYLESLWRAGKIQVYRYREIYYHVGKQKKWRQQIEFSTERNKFEKNQTWKYMKCAVKKRQL